MTCEVNNKEINSQCAELLVRPTCIVEYKLYIIGCTVYITFSAVKKICIMQCILFITRRMICFICYRVNNVSYKYNYSDIQGISFHMPV